MLRPKSYFVLRGTQFQGQDVDFIETWGRSVSEAHLSGVPVIATNDGGLPESVGSGGILVDKYADIIEWEHALRKLWDDRDFFYNLSDKSRQYSQREEFKPNYLAEKLIRILETQLPSKH